ncbi:MAG: phosphate/phosphite/phosphonate ABC transporter substrate-binding protein [Actinomycetota bacterium]
MNKRYWRLLAVLLAFVLIVAACGDDDEDETTAEPSDSASESSDDDMAEDDDMADEDMAEDDMAEEDDMADDEMAEEHSDWPDSITFGFVPSQDQAELQDDIQPFIDVLESALGIDVEGVVTTDYTGLVTSMGTDQTDLGAFGPFGYTLGKDQFGNIEPLIQSIRFGSATYHGQWFTNDPSVCQEGTLQPGTALINDGGEITQVDALEAVALQVGVFFGDDGKQSGETTDDGAAISPGSSCIGDLSSVAGQSVAFTSESSTSGYLFPALQLDTLGIDPTSDITPIFAGSHDATVTAVYNGDATFGLSFDDARRNIRKEQTDVGEQVIVFNITSEIPNDVVAVRSELPDSLKSAIYDAVADFLASEEGEAIFDEIYGWTDIRPAVESDFDVVRDAAAALGISEPPG